MLETERLVLREVEADDLPALLPVYRSNPDYLALTEGPDGYDLAKLERDWHLAQVTPGRQMLALVLKESGEVVGVLDYLDANPSDATPWIGLVIVHEKVQRRGLAAEALRALLDRWPVVRAGVIEGNERGLGLVRRLGFREVGRREQRLAGGRRRSS